MIKRGNQRQSSAQRGYAMLAIIAAIGVAATAVVVTSLSATAVRNEQGRKDSNALALAKQALIANAASSISHPGSLPCPDVDNDGLSDITTTTTPPSCTSLLGRLPWQTLGLPDLRDAAGERLWYAVSANFQDRSTNRINTNSYGQLIVRDGDQMTYGVVAIVAAPGKPVGTQNRDGSHLNSAENYLETYSSSTSTATLAAQDSMHNDQLSAITPADIFSLVERRVAKEVANALQTYYASYVTYPWPAQTAVASGGTYVFPEAAISPAPSPAAVQSGYFPSDNVNFNQILYQQLQHQTWFTDNLWNAVVNYRVDSDCAAGPAGGGTCGTLAFAGFSMGGGIGVSIGSSGGVANAGTKAVLTFSGVNTMYTNYNSTVLSAAVQ